MDIRPLILAVFLLLLSFDSLANRLNGTFLHFGYGPGDDVIPTSQVPSILEEISQLGMNTIIIAETRISPGRCAANVSDFRWLAGFPQKIRTILDEAHSRGMEVYIGGTHSGFNCSSFGSTSNIALVTQDIRQNLSLISSQHNSHPAFKGWYIPDEPPLAGGSTSFTYYRNITAELKGISPGKKVLTAPYFAGGVQLPSPAHLAQSAAAFKDITGVDIQVWQDGIGAIPSTKLFHWDRAGHSSEEYYQALQNALGTNSLWADVEIFNFGDPLFNTQANNLTGGYRSASSKRVNQQLWSSRFAAKRVSWLHQWHSSKSMGPAHGYVEAPLFQALYRGTYGIRATYLTPLNHRNYWYSRPPNAAYPDNGSKMFDRRTGDPRHPGDQAWVGFLGQFDVTIDLGSTRKVDWIGVHLLSNTQWGIKIPTRYEIFCGTTQTNLTKIEDARSPFSLADQALIVSEEYLMGNREALDATCRYVRLRFPNTGSNTFISEIEMSSER